MENLLPAIAGTLEQRVESMAAAWAQRACREVPDFFGMREDVPAIFAPSIALRLQASLAAILRSMRGDEPTAEIDATELEDARLAARWGIELEEFLRVYRIGHIVLWEELIRVTGELVQERDRYTAVLLEVCAAHADATDRVVAAIASRYQLERQQVLRVRERREQTVIRELLTGVPTDASSLQHDVDGLHLGLIAAGGARDECIALAAQQLGCTCLCVPTADGVVTGWLGGPRLLELTPDDVLAVVASPDCTVSAGSVLSGRAGFRRTHAQARDAHRAARMLGRRVVAYRDVAVEILAMQDMEAARAFVVQELGSLVEDDERSRVLRETLRAYFDSGHNAVLATERLGGINERTVAYRIRSIEERIGAMVTTRRDELSIALRLFDLMPAGATAPAAWAPDAFSAPAAP